MKHKAIIRTIKQHLESELNDGDLAQQLAHVVVEQVLTWTAPTTDLNDVGAIIGCSFGYRRLPNGNITPGPMNDNLAKVVADLYKQLNCKVYVQWETGEFPLTKTRLKELLIDLKDKEIVTIIEGWNKNKEKYEKNPNPLLIKGLDFSQRILKRIDPSLRGKHVKRSR